MQVIMCVWSGFRFTSDLCPELCEMNNLTYTNQCDIFSYLTNQ